MNFSKIIVAAVLAQALLLDLVGTSSVLCAATPLEEQQEEGTLQGAKDKSSNLRGKRSVQSLVDITTSGDNSKRQFLVKFKDHDRFMAADMELQGDPHQIMSLPDNDVKVMAFESEDELQYWEQREDVDYVEPDYMVELFAETVPYGINSVKALSISDSKVSNQKVCVVDSGYDINHPDLQSSRNFVSGKNFSGSSNWDTDENGHGTHVAGTIAAFGGNGKGVVGVIRNGQVKLHIVKVFGASGRTTISTVIRGFNECVSAGANVINMSLGGGAFSQIFNDAISNAYNQGILVIAAAGNKGNSSKFYPASYPAATSVAAVDSSNRRASFSQYNDEVDIAAPGVGVLSTVPGGRYKSVSGTSMASPHVAGVAALVWSHFPTKTAQEVRQALESTAQDLGSSGRDDFFGHGLVRADRAYNFLHESDIYFTFPPTKTNQFVHGLCVMGASFAEAKSTNAGLSYTMVSGQFDNGVSLWNDRNYVADGVSGSEMCQGGIYLKPNKHKAISSGTEISMEALSDAGGIVTLCAFIATDGRDGQWDVDLPADGFTASSSTFKYTNGSITGNMRSYCKEL